uniref:NADP-dependent oxidoreductase domain-containing protein n=1 Tax=Corethron hystrix TaxID=216773 RepID=A0A7S1B3F8_9STRA|mmetsp:Transcript_10856/g.23852  ORF Transcript_10856/g.23852 Transcript_10856/m.23852 type:complete len:499 (+) Transcript_10856:168-1664(+)
MILLGLNLLFSIVPFCFGNDTGKDITPAKVHQVGIGVGNLHHNDVSTSIEYIVSNTDEWGSPLLIDTSHASQNEHLIAKAISKGRAAYDDKKKKGGMRNKKSDNSGENDGDDATDTITIVTKVWYTHLGYNRTIISVEDSLLELSQGERNPDGTPALPPYMKVIVLIHWPRCSEEVEWMHCKDEENAVSDHTKQFGPSPLDFVPDGKTPDPWMESYLALQDLYINEKIHGIGVSNFDSREMEQLFSFATHGPHVYQGNIWQYFFDIPLMKILHEKKVAYMAYNSLNGILKGKEKAPKAFAELQAVGRELGPEAIRQLKGAGHLQELLSKDDKDVADELAVTYEPATILLSWLTRGGVNVIPRPSSHEHIVANSPNFVFSVPNMLELNGGLFAQRVNLAARSLLAREDLDSRNGQNPEQSVIANFANKIEGAVKVFWVHSETGEEHEASIAIPPGSNTQIHTHPGHEFVVRDLNGNKIGTGRHKVSASYGEKEEFSVEL